ncbi:DNA-binding transcriptional regulator, FadR family [Streptoalloteichus tenebrarius]|uniref:DNA-binding transcriptional regulator, FadR family n=1 Tax=Streptoalloteichus tenebrarius (strain ATCC 17920 / DSM 40477 / JCM 4838 / CBS 697.72 / NBRC 16177 / NCIMB 11028 / NRRL B-12390 / A12253. 1 / ISP 5477) TaxID=1933 RepID=A0ABT1I2G0_STRSD|nr:FCD domain-containing protein [Streptoalloteichus tenebrarius]MCP2261755.1 DNA-binding transcriptional regulator, FadR family [Streptoalloteichus tenebrarius]BFF00810.1 FCD domain-containing protein [Streptoalloteichus tenebrarius]
MQGLHGRVLDALGPAIAGGAHPAGSVLRIEELEERFACSRTVIREAVRVLESMNLVSSRRRVGLTVRPREEWNLYDPLVIRWRLAGADRAHQLRSLSELRSAVEPVAAGYAARRATAEQCGELVGLAIKLAATARARDLRAFLEHDIAFHRLVLHASGNEMFGRFHDVVGEVLTGRTEHHLMPAEPHPTAVRLHADVAQAIQCGDAERAEAAMREIVVQAMAEMTPVFDDA